ncbi:MAG: PorV/PorQ family protein [Elusimicrobiota bacterium]
MKSLLGTGTRVAVNKCKLNNRYAAASRCVSVFLFTVLVSLFSLITFTVDSYAAATGGQAGAFLSWGAGARSLSMGKAFIAIADDASAAYWNPAGMTQLDRKEITALHATLWSETSYDFLSFIYPTSNLGVFGINYVRLNSDGFEKWIVQYDNNNEAVVCEPVRDTNGNVYKFSDTQQALSLSYGRAVWEFISVGVTTKMVGRTLDTSSDYHLTLDAYLLAKNIKNLPLRLGLSVSNLLPLSFGDTNDKLPVSIRLGAAYNFLRDRLTISADLDKSGNSNFNWHGGAEYWLLNFVALRLGFEGDLGTGLRETTAGFGLKYKDFGVDYAFAFHSLGASHRFSGSWRFGAQITEPRHAAVRKLLEEGSEAYRQGNYLLAVSQYAKALDIDPTRIEAKSTLDKLQTISSEIEEQQGVGQEPEIMRNALTTYIDGDLKTAINGLRYVYSKQPQNDPLLRLLNKIEQQSGEVPTGADKVSRSDTPKMTVIDQKLYQAYQSILSREYDKAAFECQEVLNLEPNNITALERLGSAFLMMNQRDKAKKVWDKVLELDPGNKVILKFYSQLNK